MCRFMTATLPFVRPLVKPFACRPSEAVRLTFPTMKPITQVRRERLRELVLEAGSQVGVALRIGKDKNQIYQWLLEPNETRARNVGSKSARHLEAAFGKSEGWMDSDPEAFNDFTESSQNDYRQSRAARPTAAILAKAVSIMAVDEEVNGVYPPLKHAELLLELCDRLAAGEDAMKLIAYMTRQHHQGERNGEQEAGAGA